MDKWRVLDYIVFVTLIGIAIPFVIYGKKIDTSPHECFKSVWIVTNQLECYVPFTKPPRLVWCNFDNKTRVLNCTNVTAPAYNYTPFPQQGLSDPMFNITANLTP